MLVFINACRLLSALLSPSQFGCGGGGVVSCRDFILRAVATFWALSLVGIYPGRASVNEVQLQKVKMAIVIAL